MQGPNRRYGSIARMQKVEKAHEKFMKFKLSSTLVLGEDGGLEILHHNLQVAGSDVVHMKHLLMAQDHLESKLFNDSEDVGIVTEDEVRNAISDNHVELSQRTNFINTILCLSQSYRCIRWAYYL